MIGSTRTAPASDGRTEWPAAVAYEPDLLPPFERMRQEGIEALEEWLRWGEEWSMLLRVYAGLAPTSAVLEIGCGIGRIAFALRYLLARGSYDGFDIDRGKVGFAHERFTPTHPNFRFAWADLRNTYYRPDGGQAATSYRFPYEDGRFDVVFAASLFTHMLPDTTAHYVREAARVLRPGGRCLFSFFLLDHYRPGHPRPSIFARRDFDFDHPLEGWGDGFAMGRPENPEQMTAYRLDLVERFAADAGLALVRPAVPGMWSGTVVPWIGAQDVVLLRKE